MLGCLVKSGILGSSAIVFGWLRVVDTTPPPEGPKKASLRLTGACLGGVVLGAMISSWLRKHYEPLNNWVAVI